MKKYFMHGAGDCFPACIASLLDLPEYSDATAPITPCNDDLREFISSPSTYKDSFFDRVLAPWVKSLGYEVFSIWAAGPEGPRIAHAPSNFVGLMSVSNEQMRKLKVQHSVVCRGSFTRDATTNRCQISITEILHDPCRTERQYDEIEYIDILTPTSITKTD